MSVAYRVYEGRKYTPIFWEALSEWRMQVRANDIPFYITQGGFNNTVSASATTHNGDSVDVSVYGLSESDVATVIRIGRSLGFAAFFRTTSKAKWGTRAHGFGSYHIHAVPNGWGSPSASAKKQADSYRNGRDGLLGNGKDLGPGHVSTYYKTKWPVQKNTPTPTPTPVRPGELDMDEKKLRAIIRDELYNLQLTANGQTKSRLDFEVEDYVLGKARSVAIGNLQAQISAFAKQLGVKIDASQSAILGAISEEIGDSVREGIMTHFPSIETAEANEIAHTTIDLLVEKLSKR